MIPKFERCACDKCRCGVLLDNDYLLCSYCYENHKQSGKNHDYPTAKTEEEALNGLSKLFG